MALKAIIRQGDPTSHGGTVIEAFPTFEVFGKPAAGVGHKVVCPKCKGIFPIVAGVEKFSYFGKDVAVEGMKTACGAALIATQQQAKAEAPTGAATSAPSKTAAKAAAATSLASATNSTENQAQYFDDHFILTDPQSGQPLANLAYGLVLANGEIIYGTSDRSGRTAHTEKNTESQIVEIYVEGLK